MDNSNNDTRDLQTLRDANARLLSLLEEKDKELNKKKDKEEDLQSGKDRKRKMDTGAKISD